MPLTIPNFLTLARIIAIPVFVAAYILSPEDSNRVATVIFVLAALTDWLDGFLARKLKEISPFGAFLDPVADKLMVCTALVLLVSDQLILNNVLFQNLFILSIVVIVGREVSVVALREWMAEIGERTSVATSFLSKGKTLLQMTAIVALLYEQPVSGVPILVVGELMLYAAAVLTIWTMFLYLKTAWPSLSSRAN